MSKKRRFIFLLTRALYIGWSLLLLSILAIIIERTYSYAQYIATQNAKTSVNKDLAYRTWVASHGGVYVPVDENTLPSPYLAHIKDRDFTAIGKKFTLMNPAYTLSQMMKTYTKLYGVKTHITSKKLLNPNNKPDEWETLALNKIEQTRQQYIELSDIDDNSYLRLMNPLVTKKACLKCHAFQGYKIGDIRGGVSVAIPMKPLYKDALNSSLLVYGLFFIIWFIGIISIAFLTKKIYIYLDEKEELYEQYVYGLVSVVEKRDTYTAGHSTRVADYAVLIAKEMGFSGEECHNLHRAGMLHDIGKVAIPDSVFLKPNKLTAREYKLIQEHVTMSYDMLKNISIFNEIKEIVRNHHEHFDGSGYPRGLKGDDTPILSQVLTLADSFDAMTTDRIYKGRKSVSEALTEIAKLSGKQFNPKIVQAALHALKDTLITYSKHQNPETLLEQERFSYFYKDALTGLYNEKLLQKDIFSLSKYSQVIWISLHNLHDFNKTNGWEKGSLLLQDLANTIENNIQGTHKTYRFYGDNFLILASHTKKEEVLERDLQSLFSDKSVTYSLKSSLTNSLKEKNIQGLEDVLTKLF